MDDQLDILDKEADASEHPVATASTRQFISFRVGNEAFAIDIMAVREIKGWTETAPLPNQPDYNLGVMNLRGSIVPTFDLGRRFGMGGTQATPYHVVIIASVQERIIGLLVDAVSDILTVNEDQIRPVPDVERMTAAEYLSGIITVGEEMVVLLSLEKLFNRRDAGPMKDIAA